MNKISFHSADSNINLKNRKIIKRFLVNIFKDENKKFESLCYIFCSDSYLLKINQEFLQHNYFTDVISFQLSKPKQLLKGEIYLSVDRIKENAKSYSISYQNELLRVMIHGILHLCGYNDQTRAQKHNMRILEDYYLESFRNVPREN